MPDEFQTPKEFTKPSEFPKVKEVYVSSPEFLDRPVGYGTTGKSSKEGKSRSSNIRKMMMYLAASVTTMGTILGFSSAQPAKFDKKAFVQEHREWYCPDSDEYVYLGDNGWALIAKRSENGNYYDEFCHYNRMRYNIEDGSEYMFTAYGYDLDWTIKPIDSKKVPVWIRFVESDGSYTVEASDTADFKDTIKAVPVEPSKSDYPGKQYMLKYISYSMQDILNEFNTYVHEGDAPVYTDFDKITFNPDGTGVFLSGKKEHAFTYTTDEDPISGMITINYNGKTARANFFFDSAMPQMIFFDGLVGVGDSFAMFIATDSSKAGKETDPSEKPGGNGSKENGGKPGSDPSAEPEPGSTERVDADAAECLRNDTDWYCRETKSFIHIGRNGEGYVYTTLNADLDSYYKRMTFKLDGSLCHCQIEDFKFPSFKTDNYTIECYKTAHGFELLYGPDDKPGAKYVYEEYPSKLNGYVGELVCKKADDVLMKFRDFHIQDYNVPDGSISHLEFTTRDGGFVTISGEKHQFRYETAGDGINSTFYLYYEGEKYLGRIHYCKNGPGIQLYNPQMDGTFGPFKAQ